MENFIEEYQDLFLKFTLLPSEKFKKVIILRSSLKKYSTQSTENCTRKKTPILKTIKILSTNLEGNISRGLQKNQPL